MSVFKRLLVKSMSDVLLWQLAEDAAWSLQLPRSHLKQKTFSKHWTTASSLKGEVSREGGTEKLLKWRTLGLYRRRRVRGLLLQQRKRPWLKPARHSGSGLHRWPCGCLWRCSTAPGGPSAGGRHPDATGALSRYRRCDGWAARPSPECRSQEDAQIWGCLMLWLQLNIWSSQAWSFGLVWLVKFQCSSQSSV